MSTRCFIDPAFWSKDEMAPGPEESHHLLHVLRVRVGDVVVAFDGQGREARTEVLAAGDGSVVLRVLEECECAPPAVHLVLIQALLKGQKMDWVIQKATEIGVSRIVPVETEHAVVRLQKRQRAKRCERWQKIAREAARQCGAAWVPVIEPVQGLREYLSREADVELLLQCALAENARPLRDMVKDAKSSWGSIGILVGPEGDFAEQEMTAAQEAGAVPVSLGSNVLRAETAALFALSVLACAFLGS